MAKSGGTSDNVEVLERANDVENEVAGILIDALRKIDAEYDALVKDAEEIFEPGFFGCEVRNYNKDDHQFFVPDIVEQKVAIIDESKRRLEEIELDNNLGYIQEMAKTCQREKKIFTEKRTIMERRLNIEKIKIDLVNQQIKDTTVIKENEQTNYEQIKELTDDLHNMMISESIYPHAILELDTKCKEIEKNIRKMEGELMKYADLPPDYAKAKEKLADVLAQDRELEREIRRFVKET